MSNPDGRQGTDRAESRSSDYNRTMYAVRQLLANERAWIALVKVMAVEDGALDVQLMVNQLNADGTGVEHGVISGIPYFTLQCGGNAVTMVPEVGDCGLCVFADRDISAVKSTRDIANPGSLRQNDLADGLYLGGYLNDAPTQFIDMGPDGIHISSPVQIKLTAPEVLIETEGAVTVKAALFDCQAPAKFSETIDAGGIITAPDVLSDGKSGKDHKHRAQGATEITTEPL